MPNFHQCDGYDITTTNVLFYCINFFAWANTKKEVIVVNIYSDMYSLFAEDKDAKKYFEALSENTQKQIIMRANSVNSFDDLLEYADQYSCEG